MIKTSHKFKYFFFLSLFFFSTFYFNVEAATVKYWIGTAGGNMSTNSNWSITPGSACGANANTTAPTTTDEVEFTSSCVNSATLDQSFSTTIAKLTVNTGYTGTITQSSTNTITITGDFVMNAGIFTHTANSTAETYKVKLTVGGNFTLASGASINVDGKGFIGTYVSTGRGASAGGTYGGIGGWGSGFSGTRTTYGSVTAPINIGSGSQGAGVIANGGGAIILNITGLSTINGSISSQGAVSVSGPAGTSGSGGSVYITTGSVASATGLISVNGGNVTGLGQNGGSGGGGRVAIILGPGNTFPSSGLTITAYGGSGTYKGSAGTIYLQNGNQNLNAGDLIIDNNNFVPNFGALTLLPSGTFNVSSLSSVTLRNKGNLGLQTGNSINFSTANLIVTDRDNSYLTIQSGATAVFPATYTVSNYTLKLDTPLTLNNLIVSSTGRVSHTNNYQTESYKIDLTVNGNVTVESGGQISADSAGYGFNSGTGKATDWTGGTYGGVGGYSSSHPSVNSTVYGSIVAPVNIGSPGYEGVGGGAIKINATGEIVNNGTISAIGQAINSITRGLGSGGSIYLLSGTISGSGTISANGGQMTTNFGGGGGRVSIILSSGDFSNYSGPITARGGYSTAGYSGAAGTVFLRSSSQSSSEGTLVIENNGYTVSANSVTHLNSTVGSGLISLGQLSLGNNAKLTVNSNYSLSFANTNLATSRPSIVASSTATLTPNQSFTVRGTTDSLMSLSMASYNVTYTGFTDNTEVKLLPGTFNSIITSNTTSGIIYRLGGNVVVSSTYTIPCGVTLDLNGFNWQGTIDKLTNAGCGAVLFYSGGTINGAGEFGESGVSVCSSTGNLSAGTYTYLTITGSGTVCTLTAKTIVSSLITINSGATLYLNGQKLDAASISNSGTIKMRGDEYFTVSGAFTNNGTTEYVGNSNGSADNYILNGGTLKNLKVAFAESLDTLTAFYQTSPTLSGLVAWWRLDESSGTTAADSSGYGYTGTLTGSPTITTSVSPTFKFSNPRALVFATNKYFTVNSAPAPNYPVTLSAWIKPTILSPQVIFGEFTNSSANWYGYYLSINSSGSVSATAVNNGSFMSANSPNNTISINNWYHIVGVFESSTSRKIYVNGSLVGSNSSSVTPTLVNSVSIGASKRSTTIDNYFNGSIDDVRIYNRALSDSEISVLSSGYPTEGTVNNSLIVPGTLTITSGTFNSPQTMTVTGAYNQSAGTLIASSTLNFASDFTQTGTTIFTANQSTVNFTKNGGTQTVRPLGTFYSVGKQPTSNSTLAIYAGSTITSTGTTTLKGTADALLSVQSTNSNTQWKIDPRGGIDLAYLNVKDSNNINASTTNFNPVINAGNYPSVADGGNNTNWLFTLPTINVGSVGAQLSTTTIPASNIYIGGGFVATTTNGNLNITQVSLTQNGTLPTTYISSVSLYYKEVPDGNCDSGRTLPAGTTRFGIATDWVNKKITLNGNLPVSTVPVCIFTTLSLSGHSDINSIYNTIDLDISNPSTDIISTDSQILPNTPVGIVGSTVIVSNLSGVPAISLHTSSATISTGQNTNIIWSVANALSCTASASPSSSVWNGPIATSGTVSSGILNSHGVQYYTLTCVNNLGSNYAVAAVSVVNPNAPVINISASPSSFTTSGTSIITWSTRGEINTPDSCSFSGAWGNTGRNISGGTYNTGLINSTSYYSMSCTNSYGTTSASAGVVINNVKPDHCYNDLIDYDETALNYGGSCSSTGELDDLSGVSNGDFITLNMKDESINPTVFMFINNGITNALYMRQGPASVAKFRKLTADGINIKNGTFTKIGCNSNNCSGIKISLELEKTNPSGSINNYTIEKVFNTTSFMRSNE